MKKMENTDISNIKRITSRQRKIYRPNATRKTHKLDKN